MNDDVGDGIFKIGITNYCLSTFQRFAGRFVATTHQMDITSKSPLEEKWLIASISSDIAHTRY